MNEFEDCRTYVDHLRVEHVRMDHTLQNVQQLLSAAVEWSQKNPLSTLPPALVHLREQLVHHFREEEGGGCLEEAVCRTPGLTEDVHKVIGEHGGFLAELDAMIAEANRLEKEPQRIVPLQQAYSRFLQRMHAHETEENRILLLGFGSPAMDTLST